MSHIRKSLPIACALIAASVSNAQHAQVSAVAVHPTNPGEVWVCNRDNNSVSVVDVAAGVTTHEIDVGVRPRSLAFSADGSRVFVANQRGNVPVTVNMATGFTGSEIRGTVSVIDVAGKSVSTTLTQVGVEPYGVAVSPNGKYFAVTAFRTGAVKLFDAATLSLAAEHVYLSNLNFIAPPYTVADVDANRDGIADLGEPRGFVIRADSSRIYVTHNRSPYISVLDVTLDGAGLPTGVSLAAKIDLNTYPFDPFYNPVPVQTVASQGLPRFMEDIALSPDGSRALTPHLLHNINHDVNHSFPAFVPGDFANRVYPALSVIDAAANSFNAPGDNSRRLHNQLTDPLAPAFYAPYHSGASTGAGRASLGGVTAPVLGSPATLRIDGLAPGQSAIVYVGPQVTIPRGSFGTQLVAPRFAFPVPPSGVVTINVPDRIALNGVVIHAQARFFDLGGAPAQYSNGVKIQIGRVDVGDNKLGHRAGHPSRVAYSPDGTRALMLNRGSEDLFLYEINGANYRLASVYPPRIEFTERTSLDTSTGMGDLPLGMALAPDASTSNNDSLVYVMNELTRSLSVLRVDWTTLAITQERAQIPTLLGPDLYTYSERLGDELFEDASRAQTTGGRGTVGEFNNSCASCHFEGGEDGNVWQRPAGPRSTMPMYGGTLGTGLILWKGVRLNSGETGPMFGGENGGHGLFSDVEQQALIDMHEKLPVPLNPHLDPVTGQLTPLAQFGRDLFFGLNDTGLNPVLRRAGCADCHPTTDPNFGGLRGFTSDFIDPTLTLGENLESFDPSCFVLQSNLVGVFVRNVNSGVNVDFNNDGVLDPDRNSDGYNDIETYTPLNNDRNDPFTRDDPNSYLCPLDPLDPQSPLKVFQRDMRAFSVPTKLGVFSTGPYFHDHVAISLRTIVDPEAQAISPVYGSPAYGGQAPYPGLLKFFNEFHDVRGHEQIVPGASKVQVNLISGPNVNSDIEALLAFIESI
jgi:YVTN family beta-propeller protein